MKNVFLVLILLTFTVTASASKTKFDLHKKFNCGRFDNPLKLHANSTKILKKSQSSGLFTKKEMSLYCELIGFAWASGFYLDCGDGTQSFYIVSGFA